MWKDILYTSGPSCPSSDCADAEACRRFDASADIERQHKIDRPVNEVQTERGVFEGRSREYFLADPVRSIVLVSRRASASGRDHGVHILGRSGPSQPLIDPECELIYVCLNLLRHVLRPIRDVVNPGDVEQEYEEAWMRDQRIESLNQIVETPDVHILCAI
jgi:hypothetical protein